MRPTGNEPPDDEESDLLTDEERRSLGDPNVPDEVKAEIFERIERHRTAEREEQILDEPLEE
jgi:hypothetical protein